MRRTKAQIEADKKAALKGNSNFNVNDPAVKAKITETVIDMATYTTEDAALDAELEALAKQRPQGTDDVPSASMEVVKPKEHLEH